MSSLSIVKGNRRQILVECRQLGGKVCPSVKHEEGSGCSSGVLISAWKDMPRGAPVNNLTFVIMKISNISRVNRDKVGIQRFAHCLSLHHQGVYVMNCSGRSFYVLACPSQVTVSEVRRFPFLRHFELVLTCSRCTGLPTSLCSLFWDRTVGLYRAWHRLITFNFGLMNMQA
jgi:hypothetical protein